jgi:hypothetical protein
MVPIKTCSHNRREKSRKMPVLNRHEKSRKIPVMESGLLCKEAVVRELVLSMN